MDKFETSPSLFLEGLFSQVPESTIVVDSKITPEESKNGNPSYLNQLSEFTDSIDDDEVLIVTNHVQKKSTTGKWRKQTPTPTRQSTPYAWISTRRYVPPATLLYNQIAEAGLVKRLKNAKCEGQSVRTVIKPLILSYLEVYILSEVDKQKIVTDMVKMLGCPDQE